MDFHKTVVPFLHVTTKLEDKPYDGLLLDRKYGGFPTLLILDAKGNDITMVRERTIEGFERARDQAVMLVDLTERAATDPAAAKQLLLLRIELGKLKFDEAIAARAELDLDDAQNLLFQQRLVEQLGRMNIDDAKAARARVEWLDDVAPRADALIVDLEIREALRPLMVRVPATKPGEKPVERPWHICWDLYKAGKRPSDRPRVDQLYWQGVLNIADERGEAEALELALGKLREAFGDRPVPHLDRFDARLVELRGEKQ